MRPRAILGVPGLDPKATPFERFEQFARMIVTVPKAEADREMEKLEQRKEPSAPREKTQNGGKTGKTKT